GGEGQQGGDVPADRRAGRPGQGGVVRVQLPARIARRLRSPDGDGPRSARASAACPGMDRRRGHGLGHRGEERETMSTAPTRAGLWRFRPSRPVLGLLTLLLLFVLLLAYRGQLGNFFSLDNIQVLLHKNSIPAVAALGMLLIIVSGGIDLSVGSVVALVTVVTMQT